jgi:CRP-like cAMP-binding protein
MCVFCPMFDGEAVGCSEMDAALTGKGLDVVECAAGTSVYDEGDNVAGVYCLRSGKVALLKQDRLGEATKVAIATPGDLLGVVELLEKRNFGQTAEAVDDSVLYFIPDKTFREMIAAKPVIVFNVMKRVCQQLRELDARLENAA